MITQLERFDLCDISPNINIGIIGPSTCENSMLEHTILHILSIKLKYKGFRMSILYGPSGQIKRYNYIHKNQLKEYSIITLEPNYWNSINSISYNMLFVHSQFIYKKNIINNCNVINDMVDYSSINDFFAIQKGEIKICAPEYPATYPEIYNGNLFSYNNIMKLNRTIANSFSSRHNKDGDFHVQLQTRLKELNMIYFTIFCFQIRKILIYGYLMN